MEQIPVPRGMGKRQVIRRSEGPVPAIALLDKDNSIDEAIEEAEQLRMQATEGAFDRVRDESRIKWILDLVF